MGAQRKKGIASFECGSGNTMTIEFPNVIPPKKKYIYILLPHKEVPKKYITNTIEASNNNSKTQFYFISAKSLNDAYTQIKKYLEDGKVNGIVIAAHGAGGESHLSYMNTGTEKIDINTLSEFKHNKLRLKLPSDNLISGIDFMGLGWTKNKIIETESLLNIGNLISKDGNLVITACGGGNDNRFGEYLSELIESDINILLNGDNSQITFLGEITRTKEIIDKKTKEVLETKKIVERKAQINLDNSLRTRDTKQGWKLIRNKTTEDLGKKVVKLNNNDKTKPGIELSILEK